MCAETASTFEGRPANKEALSAIDYGLKKWHLRKQRPGRPCDATLRVEFNGSAIPGNYERAGTLYAGWTFLGQVTLAATNQPTLSHKITTTKVAPFVLDPQDFRSRSRRDVLRHLAEDGSTPGALLYRQVLKEAMEQFFGPMR